MGARRSFLLKDVFTLLGLAGGVVALGLIAKGRLAQAGYAVIAGYLVGDTLDGWWARRTGTGNKFGAELDALSDHFAHVFVAGVIFMAGAARRGQPWLGAATAGVLVAAATIRHARFAALPLGYKACWCGLPRTLSGFAALSWPLAASTRQLGAAQPWVGAAVVMVMSVMGLLPIPYRHHRGRKLGPIAYLVWAFLLAPPVLFVVHRAWVFDAFLWGCLIYTALGWLPMTAEERRAFREAYQRWADEMPAQR
jgi:phosphatidylserine synthase